MNRIFVISDTHFDHKKILDFEPIRKEVLGVSTVEEMNEAIVERWNSVVNKKDIVLHLGDWAFSQKPLYWRDKLNGEIRLILGNHDRVNKLDSNYFLSVHGTYERTVCKKKCVFTHIPVHPNQLNHRYYFNLHGHLHSKIIDDPGYINCSIERLPNMQPALLEQLIVERILKS